MIGLGATDRLPTKTGEVGDEWKVVGIPHRYPCGPFLRWGDSVTALTMVSGNTFAYVDLIAEFIVRFN